VRLDLRRGGDVARALAEIGPAAVIHTAYRQRGPGSREVNVDGSRAVAAAAARVGARLVHVSTDLVFDGAGRRPYTEDDEPAPVMEYGREKLAAEDAVRAELPEALIVRTSLIYGGAGHEPSPHEELALAAAARERDAAFFTDELRSPIQVGDLAGALLELAAGEVSGVLNVAGEDGVDRHEFARLAVAARGADPALLRPGLAADHPDPRPLDCRLDCSRARSILGVRLRGAREVLAPGAPTPDR
jgi:dTDP-4-dehydrorhamnose reductase